MSLQCLFVTFIVCVCVCHSGLCCIHVTVCHSSSFASMNMGDPPVLSSALQSYHTHPKSGLPPKASASRIQRIAAAFLAAAVGSLVVCLGQRPDPASVAVVHRIVTPLAKGSASPTSRLSPSSPPTLQTPDAIERVHGASMQTAAAGAPQVAAQPQSDGSPRLTSKPHSAPKKAHQPTSSGALFAAAVALFTSALIAVRAQSLRSAKRPDVADLLENGASDTHRWALLASSGRNDDDFGGRPRPKSKLPGDGKLSDTEALGLLASTTALVALLYVLMFFNNDILDFQDKFSGQYGFTIADVFGAVLWSAALWFTTPYQVVLVFFFENPS